MTNKPTRQSTKTRVTKKIILEDEEYVIITNILSTIPKEDPNPQNPTKLREKEENLQQPPVNKKIIEYDMDALKPFFIKYTKIDLQVDLSLIDVAKVAQRLTIIPVTYITHRYLLITPKKITMKPLLSNTKYQKAIQDVIKRIPYLEFRKPNHILSATLALNPDANITTFNPALNYVNIVEPFFFSIKRVNSKKLDILTGAKHSSPILGEEESATTGSGESLAETQLPDVFEKLFSVPVRQLIVVDRPVVIFAEKPSDLKYSYIELLKRALRELYRVYQGGLPIPSTISTSFEEVKLKIRAGGHVYTLDLDQVLEQEREREYLRYLMDRLEELYSQGLGYLVLYGTRESLKKLENLGLGITHLHLGLGKAKEESKGAQARKLWIIPRPIELRINEDKNVYGIVDLMWSRILNAGRDADALVSGGVGLDYYAASREDEYYREIARIAYDPEANLIVEPSPSGEGGLERESVVHYAVKALAVIHLKDNEYVPESEIYTEHDMEDIVLDVYAKHPKLGDLAIEVETLYGTKLPLLKLRKTVEQRLRKGLRTWIIIPSPQFFMLLPWIDEFRRAYRRQYGDLIEIFTIDIEEKKIIPFKEIINKIKSLIMSTT